MAPEMLILDEPTSGLDPAGTRLIVQILQRLQQEGKTIVIISHNMDLIFQLVNRFIVLDHGEIIFDGDKQYMLNSIHLLKKARLNLPRVLKLSRFLWEQRIIQDWQIFSRAELEKQIKMLDV
jgi:energy-coupling factor transporter ATP-binding protein EcfA2